MDRREAIRAIAGLALYACGGERPEQSASSPQSTLRVDTSSEFEVLANLKEDELVKALKRHAKTFGQVLVFDGTLEKLKPFFTLELQSRLLDPGFKTSFQRILRPYTLCRNQGIELREGSVSDGQQGTKVVSVLFSKACNSSYEITVPSYPTPFTTFPPIILTQMAIFYQKVDGNKYKIASIS